MRRSRWTEEDYARLLERRAASKPPSQKIPTLSSTFVVIPGEPQAKPRQTQSDKWLQRPSVIKYREWSNHAKRCLFDVAGVTAMSAGHLDVAAYFTIPKSCKNPSSLKGLPHLNKPDFDNILKAIADSLIVRDQRIHEGRIKKRWDDGNGARVEVSIYG